MRSILIILCALFTCATLSAQCYSVASATYVQDTTTLTTQTVPQIADDQWSQRIPIGFTFCFYGAQYDSLLIGTNGMITFNLSQSGGFCVWPIPTVTFPSASAPMNVVMGTWCDLYYNQSSGGEIFCWTSGVSPNRTFTIKYDSVPMYSCLSLPYAGRIILHEATNEIEVQVDVKYSCPQWNFGRGVIGIQNQSGTDALTAPARDPLTGSWTTSQEAWLFTPTCNVCTGVGIAEESESQLNIYPNPTSGNFTIDFSSMQNTARQINVIDVSGRVIVSQNVSGNEQQLQLHIETAGIYFVQVMNENGEIISNEKLVVE